MPFFFELLVELLPQGHRGVHPDLYGGVEVRDVLLGLGHPLADDLHHPRRLDELRPRLLGRLRQAGRLEALHLGLRLLRRRDTVCLRPVFGPLGRAALHRGPHVALHDAARGTGAVYLGEVEVVLLGQPADYGRGPEVPVGPAVGPSVSLLVSSSSGASVSVAVAWAPPPSSSPPSSASSSAAAFAAFGDLFTFALDKGYRLADGHFLALVGDQLGERSFVFGLELHRDLVGLDLGYRRPPRRPRRPRS